MPSVAHWGAALHTVRRRLVQSRTLYAASAHRWFTSYRGTHTVHCLHPYGPTLLLTNYLYQSRLGMRCDGRAVCASEDDLLLDREVTAPSFTRQMAGLPYFCRAPCVPHRQDPDRRLDDETLPWG